MSLTVTVITKVTHEIELEADDYRSIPTQSEIKNKLKDLVRSELEDQLDIDYHVDDQEVEFKTADYESFCTEIRDATQTASDDADDDYDSQDEE